MHSNTNFLHVAHSYYLITSFELDFINSSNKKSPIKGLRNMHKLESRHGVFLRAEVCGLGMKISAIRVHSLEGLALCRLEMSDVLGQ